MSERATGSRPSVVSSEGPVPRRVRLQHDERRRLILAAARRLFSERAYSDVSMADLAAAAGVARGLLHHYFGAKRDLYLAVVRDVVRIPSLPVADGSGGLSVEQVWERSVDGMLGLIESNPDLWVAALRVGVAGQDAEVQLIRDQSNEVIAEQALRAVGHDPDTATPAARALVRAYGGLVHETTLEWLLRGRLDRAQARAVMLEALPLLLDRVLPLLEDPPPSR